MTKRPVASIIKAMNSVSQPGTPKPAGRLARLATWSYEHRWKVLVVWVAALLLVTATASMVGSDYHNDYSIPGTESQQVVDTLEARAPARAGDSIQVVVHHGDGIAVAPVREKVSSMLDQVGQLDHVVSVTSPYQPGAAAISAEGTIGYATVTLDGQATDVPRESVVEMIDVAQAGAGDGLAVELGGDAVRYAQESEGGAAEGIGMIAALLILVLLFGSLIAASLPLITAIFAVGSTVGLIVLASHLSSFSDFTPPLMMLVGLGVGIDYALLIFARYRDELNADAAPEMAVRTALSTAGRAVLLAGATVMFALLGLYALGLAALQGVALAVALTVLMTLIASLTLLPAMLHILGPRLERRIRRRRRRDANESGKRWWRWSAFVQRNPWPAAILSVALLAGLSVPTFDTTLGFADAGTDDEGKTSRKAYDLLAEGFGPGFNGPLIVVAEGPSGTGGDVVDTLRDTPGVTDASFAGRGDGIATYMVFPDSKPQSEETGELVERLRDDTLPVLGQQIGTNFLVGGPTAAAVDFTDKVGERMPLFLLVVIGLSALLLAMIFRSVLIPLKAALLNLLTIGASLGVVSLLFSRSGPIESYVPVMIFAIVFGLSMDYEVFLISRIHEEWRRSGDSSRAIGAGLAATGPVITAAALIMIVVFGAFVLSPERMLQQFGLGLAVAILIDAFLVRSLIVPAVMQLLGSRAWWMPGSGRRDSSRAGSPAREPGGRSSVLEVEAESRNERNP